MSRFIPAVIVVAVAATSGAAARQAPTFKAGTNTVSIYATVIEKDGRLSPHLERDDFSIYDNGQKQPITVFSSDVQPITVVIMLDRSDSMQPNFDLERNAAQAFLGRLLPNDKVRVGSFGDEIRID